MRVLRWKAGYQTGDPEADQRNREFVRCFNSLISAAGEREHCQEIEDFIFRFGSEAERILRERDPKRDLGAELAHRLRTSLPLENQDSTSCRQCGLCALAQEKVAEHLEIPAGCLFRKT